MRRFLSRSLSAPLPTNWRPSLSPSPSPTLACPDESSSKELAIDNTDDEPSLSIAFVPPKKSGQFCHASSQTCDVGDGATSGDLSGYTQDACCFAVVGKAPYAAGCQEAGARIVVHDPYLLRACRDVIQDIPGLMWQQSPQEVDLYVLLAFLPQLEQYRDDLFTKLQDNADNKSAYKAVSTLTNYLRKEHGATLAMVADLTARGEITFDTLFAIFVPRTVVLASCDLSGEQRAFQVRSSTQICTSAVDVYDIVCDSTDIVEDLIHCGCCSVSPGATSTSTPNSSRQGARAYGRVQHRFLIPHFRGAVRIDSLNVYPLKYHPDAQRVRESLVARGEKWLELQGIHHVQYTGPAAYTLSIGASLTTVHPDVDSFVLLDRESFRRANPAYRMPDVRPDYSITLDAGAAPHTAEAFMLCPPVVYGLSISDQRWLVFNIEQIWLVTRNDPVLSHVFLKSSRGSPCPQRAGSMGALRKGASSGSGTQNDACVQPFTSALADEAFHDAPSFAEAEAAHEARHLYKEEVSALSAALEERCTRALAELHATYSMEFAMHRQIMRAMLAACAVLFLLALVLLYRLMVPSARPSRWSSPTHFTIPILSPFASVVEHESSLFNLSQVTALAVVGGIFVAIRLRCGMRRK
ncbi:hypothetical protein C8Q79DRAFT_342421 [Trametes meyenii]|nr:hypothetical protein C8Q79DRAFT_342421 [Trametes meyenii]